VVQGSERSNYYIDTLKHVLSYSPSKNYQLTFYNKNLPKSRVLNNIATNGGIDIIAAGATVEREQLLQPIWFPILKGLVGWRIPLVNKENSNLFSSNITAESFKKLTVGQLHSWSDTKILESNNIHVEKGSNFQGLFQMLAAKRFDYFPRSILEVQAELEDHKSLNITIDTNILLHYPTAYLFYVNKSNKSLAEDVAYGLEQSLKDGSFELLFNRYYGETISHATKDNRRVYHLKNPFLPTKTPLHRKELWLDLSTKNDVNL
jgi:hypothetical protein